MKHVPVIFHLSINDITSVIFSLSLLCLFSRMLKQSQSGVSLSCIKVECAKLWRNYKYTKVFLSQTQGRPLLMPLCALSGEAGQARSTIDQGKQCSSYLRMGAPEGLGGLLGQVDQTAQACPADPELHYLPSAPDREKGRACHVAWRGKLASHLPLNQRPACLWSKGPGKEAVPEM